jgi:hypothetical protein
MQRSRASKDSQPQFGQVTAIIGRAWKIVTLLTWPVQHPHPLLSADGAPVDHNTDTMTIVHGDNGAQPWTPLADRDHPSLAPCPAMMLARCLELVGPGDSPGSMNLLQAENAR